MARPARPDGLSPHPVAEYYVLFNFRKDAALAQFVIEQHIFLTTPYLAPVVFVDESRTHPPIP